MVDNAYLLDSSGSFSIFMVIKKQYTVPHSCCYSLYYSFYVQCIKYVVFYKNNYDTLLDNYQPSVLVVLTKASFAMIED